MHKGKQVAQKKHRLKARKLRERRGPAPPAARLVPLPKRFVNETETATDQIAVPVPDLLPSTPKRTRRKTAPTPSDPEHN